MFTLARVDVDEHVAVVDPRFREPARTTCGRPTRMSSEECARAGLF